MKKSLMIAILLSSILQAHPQMKIQGLEFSLYYSQDYTQDKIFHKTIDNNPNGQKVSFKTKYLLAGRMSYYAELKKEFYYKAGLELTSDYVLRNIEGAYNNSNHATRMYFITAGIGKKIWRKRTHHFFIYQGFRLGKSITNNWTGFSDGNLKISTNTNDTIGFQYVAFIYPHSSKVRLMGNTCIGYLSDININWGFQVGLEFGYDLNKPNQNKITFEEFQTGPAFSYLESYSHWYNQWTIGFRLGVVRYF